MRFIPTRFHAPLDYIVGVALIAAPWIFQFSDHTAATIVPIVLGIGLIVYSLFTNYELGVWKVAPMAVHNLIDIAAGALLVASPWLFGFADNSGERLGPPCHRRPRRDLPRPDDEAAAATATAPQRTLTDRPRHGNAGRVAGTSCTAQLLPSGSVRKTNLSYAPPPEKLVISLASTPRSTSWARACSISSTHNW